jgi:hypothetical protein
MKLERELAVEAMQNMGWTATRTKPSNHPIWEFRRPSTGGLFDVVKCKQDALSRFWVSEVAMRNDDANELMAEISRLKDQWFQKRFHGIYSRAGEA